jgi:prepilin-type processing-associated H-X9-DG protein
MKSISLSLGRTLARTAIMLSVILISVGQLAGRAAAQPDRDPCRPVRYADSTFVVCTADLRQYEVRLFWRGPGGDVLGSFDRLKQTPEGSHLAFAMNAGMYHEDRSPVGLYVENGKELKAANTRNGPGNFHLKPNGIFYVKGRQAGVLETGTYLKRKIGPEFATQSGPMLVIDGRIHPQFSEQSTSRKIRNGVGVKDQHTVVFAISEDPVTFSTFAHLFRDELGCANALFLDGSVSSLYAPSLERMDTLMPMGPIVGALRRNTR